MSDPLSGAAVVVPTYREAENLERLIKALRALSPSLRIVVVDDASPDGTGELAQRLAATHAPLRVLRRSGKLGRGSAVMAGVAAALEEPGVMAVAEMDADFSHDPKELPETFAALAEADVIVRSRYARGSAIHEWGPGRRAFSRLVNLFAPPLLDLPLSDVTNGYRAYTRRAAEALLEAPLESSGYIVLSESAVWLKRKGFTFRELPTVFVNRRRGESNLGAGEVLGAAKGFLMLLRRRP